MKPLSCLAAYFNTGDQKKPLKEFAAEVKALSPDDKQELATLAAAEMGVELEAA